MKPTDKISEHLTYREATFSATAARNGWDNTPNEKQVSNIKVWAVKVFEPLRMIVNSAIYAAIIFRCKKLNTAIGGDDQSQHMCDGGDAAGDLDNDSHKDCVSNDVLFMAAYNHTIVDYDQLIAECIDDNGHVGWVHISHDCEKPKQRRQSLVSFIVDGKMKYFPFDITKGLVKSKYL